MVFQRSDSAERLRAKFVSVSLLGFSALTSAPALAQRANENALVSAEDAFGTSVGNEASGLYDARNARGFNPQSAGNARIEGMYFDRPFSGPGDVLNDRLMTGFTVRVGLAVQSYPFPAPSGIVDVTLRIPRSDHARGSVLATFGPYDTMGLEVDAETPVVADRLAVQVAGKVQNFRSDFGTTAKDWSAAVLSHWTPNDNIEIVPFWGRYERSDFENPPLLYTFGNQLPPRIERGVNFQQDWVDFEQHETNFGVIGRARLSDNWTLRTGLFRAWYYRAEDNGAFFTSIMPDGSADLLFQSQPPQRYSSYSGEVRASGVFTQGDFRHSVHFTARGRDSVRRVAGTSQIPAGRVIIGVPTPVARPNFVYTEKTTDLAQQYTGGAIYELQWRRVGGFSMGLQKTTYSRNVRACPACPGSEVTLSPWLYNGTVNAYPTAKMTVFGSYTRGLEESGVAPQVARNRGQALPNSFTSQIDGGIAYQLMPKVKVATTLFKIAKPYFDRDNTNLFTNVGNLTHEGIEFSATGTVAPNLTMLAGVVLLKARVTGPLVDQGIIGSIPLGRDARAARFDLQYGPPSWRGISVDGQIDYLDRGYANPRNQANIPPRTVFNLGARYRFKIASASSTLRVRVQNLTNTYAWEYLGGTNYYLGYVPRRRVTVSLASDF